jgi:hypothetical protein
MIAITTRSSIRVKARLLEFCWKLDIESVSVVLEG